MDLKSMEKQQIDKSVTDSLFNELRSQRRTKWGVAIFLFVFRVANFHALLVLLWIFRLYSRKFKYFCEAKFLSLIGT